MRTQLVRIGNSQGIRIPKPVIRQLSLEGEVELSLGDGVLIVAPVRHPRSGWAEAFQNMARKGDDEPLLPEPTLSGDWDEKEWEWK